MRTARILNFCLFVALSGPPLIPAAATSAEPPNIVIILVDDMGYGDPGCYNPDSKIPTPHIDSLARDGMRFTDAHAPAPVPPVALRPDDWALPIPD